MWGSDVGFVSADHIDYRMKLVGLLTLSDEQREAIFWSNPARLFRLATEPERKHIEHPAGAAARTWEPAAMIESQ